MSTPIETVAASLHQYVQTAIRTIEAGLPSDRALREVSGAAATAEMLLLREVEHGGPLTLPGLDIATRRALEGLRQHRDDIARAIYEAIPDPDRAWEHLDQWSKGAYRTMADAVLAFLTREAS